MQILGLNEPEVLDPFVAACPAASWIGTPPGPPGPPGQAGSRTTKRAKEQREDGSRRLVCPERY